MKKLATGRPAMLILALLIIVVFLLSLTLISKINSSGISQELSGVSPLATPTPAPWETANPVPTATPRTPITIARTIDLTEGTPVPQEDIEIVIVDRQNGTHDQYLVPPWLWSGEAIKLLEQKMEIQPGDYYSYLFPVDHHFLIERIKEILPIEPQSSIPTEEINHSDATATPQSKSFARIVDLANGTPFPSAEIIPLLVRRADGSLEKYLIPLTLLPDLSTHTLSRLTDAKPCDAVLRPVLAQPKVLPEGVRRIPTPMPERGMPPFNGCWPISLPYDMTTFNLAGDLPDEEIALVIVLRVTGIYEKYLLPLEPVLTNNTVDGLDSYLHFAPGDALLEGRPLAPKRQAAYPPPSTDQTSTPTVPSPPSSEMMTKVVSAPGPAANLNTPTPDHDVSIIVTPEAPPATLSLGTPMDLTRNNQPLVPSPMPTATPKPYAGLVISKIEPVANGPYLNMLWSPDGKQLLASKQASTYKLLGRASQKSNNGSLAEMQNIVSGVNDLWLVDVGTAKEQKILDRVSTYAWSPDGKRFVYIQPVNDEGFAGEVRIYNLADGTSSLLTKADFLGTAYAYSIQWLATDEIIFVHDWQLWSIRSDGSNLHRIPGYIFIGSLLSSVVGSTELAQNEKSSLRLMSFQFSQDGKHVAFVTSHLEFDTIARKLYIANADGSGQYLVTGQAEGSYHEWSPDSKWLVFNTFRGINDPNLDQHDSGYQGLWVISADGKEQLPLLQRNDWYLLASPVWSPDSSQIAFIVVSPQTHAGRDREIWIGDIPHATTAARLGGSNDQNEDIRLLWWEPDGQSILRLKVDASNLYAMDRMLTQEVTTIVDVDRPGLTSTPKPEPTVFDLAKGLADEQIFVVLIVRANGDVAKF